MTNIVINCHKTLRGIQLFYLTITAFILHKITPGELISDYEMVIINYINCKNQSKSVWNLIRIIAESITKYVGWDRCVDGVFRDMV